jgi:serine/threonine-protein kinase
MNADDTNEAQRFHVGSTIAGRYLVERPIGEGAMGAVALARHVSLDETVAIKFLRPELRRDPVAIGRLSREAKALARIKSDHVTRVLDVGATLSVGPYMVMEYLEGTDLGELLDEEGPLPIARAVECVLQLCEALTVAHTAGIVHRDIKPQNLFLARHGQFETLKVLDFGICDGAVASVPGADRIPYGTPSYMSPERVRNDASADHRADIWSIGVVLHELVTGRVVFDGDDVTDVCARIVSDAPIALEADARVLPSELRAIIERCLERDPCRRYQSVEELAAALAPLATMQERFRGRTTGAFSRRLLEQELASVRSLEPAASSIPTPSGVAPAAPAHSSGLGSGLAARLGALGQGLSSARLAHLVSLRALGLALAGLLVVVSLVRGVAWMAPPPGSSSAAPGAASAAPSGAQVPADRAPFAATLAPTSSSPAAPPSPAAPGQLDAEAAGLDDTSAAAPPRRSETRRAAARARGKTRAPRAKRARAVAGAEGRARDKAREASAADAPASAEGRTHTSRVRLVADRRAERSSERAATTPRSSIASPPSTTLQPESPPGADGSGGAAVREPPRDGKDEGRAATKPLPEWLRSSQRPRAGAP